jgi:hypothetical protein
MTEQHQSINETVSVLGTRRAHTGESTMKREERTWERAEGHMVRAWRMTGTQSVLGWVVLWPGSVFTTFLNELIV